MLLDCDVVLMRDPAYMFDAPQYKALGNYFWDDIYGSGMFKEELFDYVGELPMPLTAPLLLPWHSSMYGTLHIL